jgi:hypothetical protein
MTTYIKSHLDTGSDETPSFSDWPHAPAHRLGEKGAYMVTAGAYNKYPFLNSPGRLDLALNLLFNCALEFGWQLQARDRRQLRHSSIRMRITQTVFSIVSLPASITAMACSRLTVGKASRKSSMDSPPSK